MASEINSQLIRFHPLTIYIYDGAFEEGLIFGKP